MVKEQAGGQGFEPRLADPESAVLPIRRSPSDSFSDCYYTMVRETGQVWDGLKAIIP